MRNIALISASNKEGLGSIARALANLGFELVATGKTRLTLEEDGLKVIDISDLTQEPERFGGRLKTLHHKVLGGILFRPDRDESEWPYDFRIGAVVCNFYPFEEKAAQCDDIESLMEWVDIGGPTMVRAAAKNHPHVFLFTRPDQYTRFIAAPQEEYPRLKMRFAVEAFDTVARLDEAILTHFQWRYMTGQATLPDLVYGENPHQKAQFLPNRNSSLKFYGNFSYNNIRDAEGALRAVLPFEGPAAAVIKHQTLCGFAAGLEGADEDKVFEWAWEGDTVSRFGGILAFNYLPSARITSEILAKKFIEVVVAPRTSAADEWAERLHAEKPKVRVLLVDPAVFGKKPEALEMHSGLLGKVWQESDWIDMTETSLDPEKLLMAFGEWAAASSKSNAMALCGFDEASRAVYLAGVGQGQPNRVEALKHLAIPRAKEFASRRGIPDEGLVCFSDAFLPFEDSLETLAAAGLKRLVQPGGSKRDDEVADAARKLGVHMTIRGKRHFWH